MKTYKDYYIDMVINHNKVIEKLKDFEKKEMELKILTNMSFDELIDSLKSGKELK